MLRRPLLQRVLRVLRAVPDHVDGRAARAGHLDRHHLPCIVLPDGTRLPLCVHPAHNDPDHHHQPGRNDVLVGHLAQRRLPGQPGHGEEEGGREKERVGGRRRGWEGEGRH